MNGEQRRSGAPQGPPWSLDLLADLHAEALDADTARELRPLAQRDPAAGAVLAGLDATRRELADLSPLTMPDDVTQRICAALAAEASSPAPASEAAVVDLAQARRRRRRVGWGLAALTAAAAALVVVIASSTLPRTTPEATNPPASALSPQPMTFSGSQVRLDRTQLTEALRSRQYAAALSDQRTLQGCLQANGVVGEPVGARAVTLDGRPAQMLILSTGTIGRFRVLVVGLDCGPGNPATVSDSTFGG